MTKGLLLDLVNKHKDFALASREYFHRYPELANEEFKTSAYIQEVLRKANIEYTSFYDMTGVIGTIRGGRPGKTVALRADMDALPIQEDSNKPYASEHPGLMHACGHDAHMAILLGTALALEEIKEELKGNVRLIFQPAEEAIGGAERMIAAGCMDNPKVDYVFGLHVDPTIETSYVKSKSGILFAANDSYDVIIKGQKAHGAKPHTGHDAILALASIIMEIQTIVSRRISPHEGVVITIGEISGGTVRNVIADKAEMAMTVRAVNNETRQKIRELLPLMIDHASSLHGVKGEVKLIKGYDALYNDEACVALVESVAKKVLSKDAYITRELPTMRSEDFSYYAQLAPAAFFELGCRNEELGITAETHNSQFDIDPASIASGMKMMIGLVLELLMTS